MKPNHVLLGSVLVAALALTSTSARADEVKVNAPAAGGCTNCGGDGSSCAGCGDNGKLHWHPGQGIANLHACASAKIHSIADSFHHAKPAYAPPQIPPQYLYNPYNRSPRDYFMSER